MMRSTSCGVCFRYRRKSSLAAEGESPTIASGSLSGAQPAFIKVAGPLRGTCSLASRREFQSFMRHKIELLFPQEPAVRTNLRPSVVAAQFASAGRVSAADAETALHSTAVHGPENARSGPLLPRRFDSISQIAFSRARYPAVLAENSSRGNPPFRPGVKSWNDFKVPPPGCLSCATILGRSRSSDK